jgi:UDP-N-acetylglucosamine 2-epimerase (non-hydrolysing)
MGESAVNEVQAIAYLVGARPNYVKMAPLVAELRRRAPELRHVVINTGQHYDREMSGIFLDELEIGPPDFDLDVGSGSHGAQTARALERIEGVLEHLRPAALVVPGDVNSTLAGALAAAKLGVPIAHLEAGLRSFDRSMPEEINRVLTDQLSTWCFTHSPEAAENLLHEGVDPTSIFFVGNTMIDTLELMMDAVGRSTILRDFELESNGYVLATLHRPGLVDGASFEPVLESLARLSEWLPVIFPVHPRTRARIESGRQRGSLRLTAPVGYVDFLSLESNARVVVTDSGGVQEETTYLGVPCFTMRENTERPITVLQGTNHVIGTDPAALDDVPRAVSEWSPPSEPLEGWDGHAATRVADVLLAALRPIVEPLEAG